MLNIDDRLLSELNESEMFLCLHILKRMKSSRMTAWPGTKTLCEDCSWDERTLKKWRKSLIDKGIISIKESPGKANVYRFKKSGFGVFSNANEVELEEESDGGTENVGGTENAVKGGQKMYPEVINKEVIKNKSKVEKPYWETCYSFAEFWNEYGHKVGSKKKAEQAFDKLSEKDRADIKTSLATYVNGTVTAKVSILPGQAFRPFRAHPTTFLNERRWETILETALEKIEANKNILPEWDEAYNKYIDWIKRDYPVLLNSAKYLSKKQYAAYFTENYVAGVSYVGKEAQKKLLTKCHNEMNDNPDMLNKYTDVFAMHCDKMVFEVTSRQI